jgi:radical SAM superfamily enzyme YgiQ (UPF0313 family)
MQHSLLLEPTSADQPDGCDVLLVGYESQENLGLRSIAAYLRQHGVLVRIQQLQSATNDEVLARIEAERPRVVGFSLIFQRLLPQFQELIAHLRRGGVQAHFTMGGHFPTIEYESVLGLLPGLDTIVRHEGEFTLLDLYHHVDEPRTWDTIQGLAFRRDGQVVRTAPRPLIADLDTLPFPVRNGVTATHRGVGISSLASSRGCYYDCTFCSIHEFYEGTVGPRRRTRTPANVAQEMELLRRDLGVRVFIFQDDDMSMRSRHHRAWIDEFARELKARHLADDITWRVSCRVDDLDAEVLKRLQEVGLGSVYLGIESGCEAGLRAFNKRYHVSDIYEAVDMLDRIDLPFEFGFMILDPDATFDTVRENIAFLHRISDAGRSTVNFCKMAPYSGTRIARRLQAEGRLAGSVDSPDYRFADGRLDLFQIFMAQTFNLRNFSDAGMVERLRFAKFDALTVERLLPGLCDARAYRDGVRDLIRRSNESALEALGLAATLMSQCREDEIVANWALVDSWRRQELRYQAQLTAELDALEATYGSPISRWAGASEPGTVPRPPRAVERLVAGRVS